MNADPQIPEPRFSGIEGRLALVTGGLGGLGAEIVDSLLNQGARTIVVDLPHVTTRDGLPENLEAYYALDVADHKRVCETMEAITQAHGAPDLVVNAAGIAGDSTAAEHLDPGEWGRVMSVNLSGTFWIAQECGRRLIADGRRGAILNISSVAGVAVPSGHQRVHYATSKAGVIMLTRALAVEWGPHGIRVNAVCPGLHMTPMIADVLSDPDEAARFRERARSHTPLRRIAEASDIRGVAMFLLSSASENITGQAIVSDGGRLLTYV